MPYLSSQPYEKVDSKIFHFFCSSFFGLKFVDISQLH